MITKEDITLLLAEMLDEEALKESLNELDLTEATRVILSEELDRRKKQS